VRGDVPGLVEHRNCQLLLGAENHTSAGCHRCNRYGSLGFWSFYDALWSEREPIQDYMLSVYLDDLKGYRIVRSDHHIAFHGTINCAALTRNHWHTGFRVGRQLVDRYTASRPRLGDDLDVIKFICKEFWHELFHKQVFLLLFNRTPLGCPLRRISATLRASRLLMIW